MVSWPDANETRVGGTGKAGVGFFERDSQRGILLSGTNKTTDAQHHLFHPRVPISSRPCVPLYPRAARLSYNARPRPPYALVTWQHEPTRTRTTPGKNSVHVGRLCRKLVKNSPLSHRGCPLFFATFRKKIRVARIDDNFNSYRDLTTHASPMKANL